MVFKANTIMSQLVQPAVIALEQKIDENLCALFSDIPYYVGTPGSTPGSVGSITSIRKEMNDNKVPMMGRMAVLDSSADAKLLEFDTVNSLSNTGKTDAIINARRGRKFGLDFFMDQNIKRHTNGDPSAGATTKLAAAMTKNVNMATFADTALTGVIKKGTIFKIAGDDRPYVVKKDAAFTVIGDHTANLAFHRTW